MRYVCVLELGGPGVAATSHGEWEAQAFVQNRGGLEGVQSGSASRRTPSAGEVEIAVDAAGLNFKDIL